jgi:hypothetical protein
MSYGSSNQPDEMNRTNMPENGKSEWGTHLPPSFQSSTLELNEML